jgi:hypothetical protein
LESGLNCRRDGRSVRHRLVRLTREPGVITPARR